MIRDWLEGFTWAALCIAVFYGFSNGALILNMIAAGTYP